MDVEGDRDIGEGTGFLGEVLYGRHRCMFELITANYLASRYSAEDHSEKYVYY